MDKKAEISRLLAVKNALTATCATMGWRYVKQMADNVVKKCVQEALDEEDPQRGEAKRLKAKALQKGFDDLWSAIEGAKQIDPQSDFEIFEQLETGERADA